MIFIKPKDQFMFLAMLAFIFISSTALAASGNIPEIIPTLAKTTETFAPIPTLSNKSGFPIVSAQGALAVDLSSGISLYEKNADNTYYRKSPI